MYLGRFQLGDDVVFPLIAVNGSGTPTLPDQAPYAEIFSDSEKVFTGRMPAADSSLDTALFRMYVRLDEQFAVGRHTAICRYFLSETPYAELFTFEIIAGGDAAGAVIAIHNYERPGRRNVVVQLDGGRLRVNKNPRLS